MNSPINDNITDVLFNLLSKTDLVSNEQLNILNISCDVNRVYSILTSKYNNCNIYNIEMNSYYERNLNKCPNTVLGNINSLNLDFDEDYFDIIIVDDSLQKFIDPWEVLKCLYKVINKEGYLFATIPNMMHINNLFNIINGNIVYTNSGPLDSDNLRFFTLSGIKNMLFSTGYNIIEINSVSTQQEPSLLSVVNLISHTTDTEFINQFFCFQYILKISPCKVKTLFDYIS